MFVKYFDEYVLLYSEMLHFDLIEEIPSFHATSKPLRKEKVYINVIGKMFLFKFVFEQKFLSNETIWSLNPDCLKMLNQIPACNNFKKPTYLILNVFSIIILYNRNIFSLSLSLKKWSLLMFGIKQKIYFID